MSLKYLGKKNILIVEDSTFSMQLLKSLLERVSIMNLIYAYDGKCALEKLGNREEKIDMILLDIRMPIMGGEDMLMHIKQNRDYDDIPILIISVDNSNEAGLRKLGASDFIQKPFNLDDLVSKISAGFKDSPERSCP